MVRRVRIGALQLDACTADEARALVAARRGGPRAAAGLGFVNPHVYTLCTAPGVAAFLQTCDAVCVDGIGVVMAGRLAGGPRLPRVPMHQLFDACVASGLLRGRAVLLGLQPRETALAVARLRDAAPDAEFVAWHHGFLDDREYAAILREHRDADLVLVGMGSPRSEQVLLRARGECGQALCWHVGGGTLRQWAGTKRRAPPLVSRLGLEWVHRAVHEPETRRRYAAGLARFAHRFAVDTWRHRAGSRER